MTFSLLKTKFPGEKFNLRQAVCLVSGCCGKLGVCSNLFMTIHQDFDLYISQENYWSYLNKTLSESSFSAPFSTIFEVYIYIYGEIFREKTWHFSSLNTVLMMNTSPPVHAQSNFVRTSTFFRFIQKYWYIKINWRICLKPVN